MIFNNTGKMIKQDFFIDQKKIEIVQTFCYLGVDIKASGAVSTGMNALYDKARKAMRPIMGIIARFHISPKTSLNLFHTYISPIALYAAENWMTLNDRKLQNISEKTMFGSTENIKLDMLHRHFLKYILGTSKSCPNMAVYGELGEIPLSLKGYRLLINYWFHTTRLPNDSLAKAALQENIDIRSNWIKTIEKLLNFFRLTDIPETLDIFKTRNRLQIRNSYVNYWKKALKDDNLSRLKFYSEIKTELSPEAYLDIPDFNLRKTITKTRCSDHDLEIEKGRHRKVPREERFCQLCHANEIETEHHFLNVCPFFDALRTKYSLATDNATILLTKTPPNVIGKYLAEAFLERNKCLQRSGSS